MATNKMIIIGAGVAGLATGYYACKNGYKVDIFEMQGKPGGMCTSWQRRDYTFDYCIHNLAGTSQYSGIYQVWKELGAFDGTDLLHHDEFVRIENLSGNVLHWYTDLDRLENHLKQIAPEDSRILGQLITAARRLAGADLSAMSMGGFSRTLKVFTRLPTINRWAKVTIGQFARQLRNPFLKRAFLHIMYDMPGELVPIMALIIFMAGFIRGDFGWPMNGSLGLSTRIEKKLQAAGANIHYKAPVEKIIVENGCAVGILLQDGTQYRADKIISAADGYSTIFEMLEGRYVTEPIKKYYGSAGESSPFGLIVFLGVKKEYPDMPKALTLLFDKPFDVGEIEQDSLHVVTYGHETGLVPQGKSIIKIEAQASYPYWKKRRGRSLEVYRAEKEKIGQKIIGLISPRFPGLKNEIEVIDISTPLTAERYTGNRFGWQAGPPEENAAEIQRKGLSKTLPGLLNFYHVGQWSMATLGVSNVAVMGRNLVKELCKEDRRRFITG